MFFRFQVYTIHLSENILTHGNCGCRRQSLWVTRSTLQKRARPPKALVTGWHAPVSTPSRSRRVCHLSAGSGARYQAALCESVIGFLSSLSSTPTVVTFVNVTQDTRALSIFVAPGYKLCLGPWPPQPLQSSRCLFQHPIMACFTYHSVPKVS